MSFSYDQCKEKFNFNELNVNIHNIKTEISLLNQQKYKTVSFNSKVFIPINIICVAIY